MRTSVDSSTASKCVTGIYTSNYNVTFYDMDYNNVTYTTEYAVKLINQLITGLSLGIPTLFITSSVFSPSIILDNSKLLNYYIITLSYIYYNSERWFISNNNY